MRTWAGRSARDIKRSIEERPDRKHACEPRLERGQPLLARRPDNEKKTYAPHAPEVERIANERASTRYESGTKASIA
jgi:hypothetical protein